MELSPRRGALVALLALVPVGLFAASRGEPVVAVAMVNVLLIVGSLYVALSPVAGGHGHGADASA